MPISVRNSLFSDVSRSEYILPSKDMVPASGEWMPKRLFNKTVFPEPLCPIIKFVLPVSKTLETPLRTLLSPNDFSKLSLRLKITSLFTNYLIFIILKCLDIIFHLFLVLLKFLFLTAIIYKIIHFYFFI